MSFSRPSDIDASWQFISQGVDIIMKRDLAHLDLTTGVYMNMYTAIHNFCVATHPPPPATSQAPRSGRGHHTKLLGGELYQRLVEYLKSHLQDLLRAAPEPHAGEPAQTFQERLIAYYNHCWDRYTTGARYLDHIFSYLNRHWVKQERDEGGRQRGVYDVNTLCLVLWRDNMFLSLGSALVDALLASIERDRDGMQVDASALKVCIHSMVSVGFDDQNSKRTNLLFYSQHFEKPFIDATAAYYARESQELLVNHGVVYYMRRVSERLTEERQRVSKYLHRSTEELLVAECERLLIQTHEGKIQSEFSGLLTENRLSDLRVMFELLSRVPHGLTPVHKKLRVFVEQKGNERVNELAAEMQGQPIEPKRYVEVLLGVCDYFENLVKISFAGSEEMTAAVDDGCKSFINSNVIAKSAAGADSRTPELLARFSDTLLKKSSRISDPQQVDQGLNGVLHLLRHTEEKDVFEKHYSRMLSRRLVHQMSANPDWEAQMVSRLGQICGFEYTNKLNRMFQDVSTSKNLQTMFKDREHTPLADSFAPFVLANGFWPLPYREVSEFQLPGELQTTFDHFCTFYDEIHNGRKLKWLWNFGKGEMKLNMPNGRAVLLQVSIYQMAILLAFNDKDTLSKQELKAQVPLPSELLDGSLGYIVKAGILTENPAGVYAFNEDFKPKRMRVNLNLPLKTEQRQEVTESERQIEEQRQGFLQAIIVRVMKARQQLSHAQLVEEVMQQARKRFNPSVKDIKRSVTALLERDYLKRSATATDVYEYAA